MADLKAGFEEYRKACYGDRVLHERQLTEVRQAFFSGVHFHNSRGVYDPDEVTAALRSLFGEYSPNDQGKPVAETDLEFRKTTGGNSASPAC